MVQNEYLELLLEIGLIGFTLFAVIIVGFFKKTKRAPWIWAIMLAILMQWWFFSGYPNTLHVFMVVAVLYVFALTKTEKK